jgi:large subunit ribosomal protein L25
MKIVELEATRREGKGKGPARRLRAQGFIPAIVYGSGEPVPVSVPVRELEKLLRHEEGTGILVDLLLKDGEQKRIRTLLKEVQRDPVSSEALHADFQAIREGQKLHLSVPVRLVGTAVGVKDEGGLLDHILRELEIECTAEHIPAHIEVDVSELHVGQALHVSDIEPPEGVRIRNRPEAVIVAVEGKTVEAPAEEEAAAAEAEAAAEEGAEEKGEKAAEEEKKSGESGS